MRQRLAFVVAHYNEDRTASRFFKAVDDADIPMIQRRGGSCFAEELLFVGRTKRCISRQELERDRALKLHIKSFVNHTHSASTELFGDAVMRNGLTDHLG